MTNTTTVKDLVTATVGAYHGTDAPVMDAKWSRVDILASNPGLKDKMDALGYSADAYVNASTGELIIANRGTIGNVQNLVSDVRLGLFAAHAAQEIANQFADQAISTAQSLLSENGGSLGSIYTTGHSLGGAESQSQTVHISQLIHDGVLLPGDSHVTSIGFDAPGIAGLAASADMTHASSINFFAQGDLIHLSGGSDLPGSVVTSIPVGPAYFATGGLMGLGLASNGGGLLGALIGKLFTAAGANNTLAAHSSSLFLDDSIKNSALWGSTVEDLTKNGLSETQMKNLLGVSKSDYDALTPTQKAELLGKSPDSSVEPVYDAHGYDQNGFDAHGYNIYGKDKDGHLDPSIAQSGSSTHTEQLNNGSNLDVVISGDGSYVGSLNDTDGSSVTAYIGPDGHIIGAAVQTPDGMQGNLETHEDGSATITTGITQPDGSTVAESSLITPSGVVAAQTTIKRSIDGSSSATTTAADGSSVTAFQGPDRSSEVDVVHSDGSYVKTANNGLGQTVTVIGDVDGTVHNTVRDSAGNVTSEVISPNGTHTINWQTWNGVHGTKTVDAAGNYTASAAVYLDKISFSGNPLIRGWSDDGAHYIAIKYTLDMSFSHTHNVNGHDDWTMNQYEWTEKGAGNILAEVTKIDGVYTKATTTDAIGTHNILDDQGRVWLPWLDDYTQESRDQDFHLNQAILGNYADTPPGILTDPLKHLAYNLPLETTSQISESATMADDVRNFVLTGTETINARGNQWNNVILANNGDDILDGGGGEDTLIGGNGLDTFQALAIDGKHDTIFSGRGGSKFQVNNGQGTATIKNSLHTDIIYLDAGIAKNDITASASVSADGSTDVKLSLSAGGSIDILDNLKTGMLRDVVFADGTKTTLSALIADSNPDTGLQSNVSITMPATTLDLHLTGSAAITARGNALDNLIVANSGNDTLIGGSGNDTLVAGGGSSTLVGGDGVPGHGSTTFKISLGNGQTTITSSTWGDVLLFGEGILPQDVQVFAPVTPWNGGAQTITVFVGGQLHYLDGGAHNHFLDQVQFADGTKMTLLQLQQQTPGGISTSIAVPDGVSAFHTPGTGDVVVTANNSDVTIWANSGYDTLIGGSGTDTLIGSDVHATILIAGTGASTLISGAAASEFDINANSGNVKIISKSAQDAIRFDNSFAINGITAHAVVAQDGTREVRLDLPNGKSILVEETQGALLSTVRYGANLDTTISHLLLQSDPVNTELSSAVGGDVPWGILNFILTGTDNLTVIGSGLDTRIVANSGNDTLIAGSGHDTLVGGSGRDLLISSGSERGTIFEIDQGFGQITIRSSSPADTIFFGPGIHASDLTIREISNPWGTGERSFLIASDAGGQILLHNPVDGGAALLHFADTGDMNIGDMLENDGVNSFNTDVDATMPDQYHTAVLTGNQSITVTGNSHDNIIFGNNAPDTFVSGSGNSTFFGQAQGNTYIINKATDVVIDHAGGGQIISSVDYTMPENVIKLTGAGDESLTLTGNSAYHTIISNGHSDTLIAGTGSATLVSGYGDSADVLVGGLADNTYEIHSHTAIIEAKTNASSNNIATDLSYELPTGFNAIYGIGTTDITLSGNATDNIVTANDGNDILNGGGGTDVLEAFAGNSTLTQLQGSALLIGGAGDSSMAVSSGTAVYVSGAGSDSIFLGAGPSMVAFNLGGTHDVVMAGSGTHNVLSIGGGALLSDLLLSKSGDDLVVSVSQTDSITLNNWYQDSNQQVFTALQFIESASSDFDPASANALLAHAVEIFDFKALVASFDGARAATPSIANWHVDSALPNALIGTHDTEAIGGDLAYYSGTQSLFGMGLSNVAAILNDPDFVVSLQGIHAPENVYGGSVVV